MVQQQTKRNIEMLFLLSKPLQFLCLSSLFIIIIIILYFPTTISPLSLYAACSDNDNYTADSMFGANLDALLSTFAFESSSLLLQLMAQSPALPTPPLARTQTKFMALRSAKVTLQWTLAKVASKLQSREEFSCAPTKDEQAYGK